MMVLFLTMVVVLLAAAVTALWIVALECVKAQGALTARVRRIEERAPAPKPKAEPVSKWDPAATEACR